MRLTKRTPRFDQLAELFTFECEVCDVRRTETA